MNKYKAQKIVTSTISNFFKIVISLFFAFPFYWMFITSFKTYSESVVFPPTMWPQIFTTEAYKTVFEGINLLPYLKNSLIIIVCIIVMQLVVMVPSAYSFARYNFKGNGILFGLVTIAFMVPSQVTFVSVYIMFSRMGIIKTLIPQILPFGANAFGIFLLRQTFKQVPDELVESARLDDAGEIKIMTKIMIPMAKSTFVTIALLSFISHWNAYFWPLVMTNNEAYRPLTMVVERIRDAEMGLQWNTIMAANCILVVPVIIIFIFFSKKIIEGFTYRGVK